MGGAFVHGDCAYLANQTNIGANNNKFYRGQLLEAGGKYYSWTRWGRVGEPGQNALAGPTSKADAMKAFEKKFKDKTGHNWDGGGATYPAKGGKYTVIFESHDESNSQAEKLQKVQEDNPVVKYAAPKTKGALADFVKLVTSNDMFAEQLQTLGVDTSKMPLGNIDQRTIDAGNEALTAIEDYLESTKKPNDKRLAELCSTFYTYIPHSFGRKAAPLLRKGDIQNKRDMLSVISDVGAAVDAQKKKKGGKKKGAKAVVEEPALIDQAYESLDATLDI